jgi:hypothetical protein
LSKTKKNVKKRRRIKNVTTLSLVSVSHIYSTHLFSLYLTHYAHKPYLFVHDEYCNRISLLYDDLLVRILSNHTTCESVTTTTLLKWWIKGFRGVTCLKLDDKNGSLLHVLQKTQLQIDLKKFNLSSVLCWNGNINNHIERSVWKKVEMNLEFDTLPFMVYWTIILLDLSSTPVLLWSWNFIICALWDFIYCLFAFAQYSFSAASRFWRSCGFCLMVFYILFETENLSFFLVFAIPFYKWFLVICLSCWLRFHMS